jgi:hypothetical protein
MRSLLVGLLMLMANEARAQVCTKDSDCSGQLLCIDGTCAEAGGAGGGQSSDPKPPPPRSPPPPPPEKDESGVNVRYSDEPGGGQRMPVRYVERPLTLPHMVLRPEADLSVLHISIEDPVDDVNAVGLSLGASIGLFDDLELGITLLPIRLSPDFDFGNIPLYGRYRFLDGPVELGAELALLIPTDNLFGLTPGVPVRFHGGDVVSVDTGVYFPLATSVGGEFDTGTTFGLSIPVEVNVQIIDMIFAGIATGFNVQFVTGSDFIDIADTISFPLLIQAGFTLPSDQGPMLDISANFGFPFLIEPGADDKLISEVFVFSVSGKFHIFL